MSSLAQLVVILGVVLTVLLAAVFMGEAIYHWGGLALRRRFGRDSKGGGAFELGDLSIDEEYQQVEGENNLPGRLITILEPSSAASAAYRSLGADLFLCSSVNHPPKIIVLASPGAGEEKSATCANLGVVLAQAGKSALLVDCDFRKPALHEFFGLSNTFGMSNVLTKRRVLTETRELQEKFWEDWEEPLSGLKIVPTGPIPLNGPAVLLDPTYLLKFFASARRVFDYALVNAPPMSFVDTLNLATQGDAVIFVLDAWKTSSKRSARQEARSLQAFGANVHAAVMSNVIEGLAGAPPGRARVSSRTPGQRLSEKPWRRR